MYQLLGVWWIVIISYNLTILLVYNIMQAIRIENLYTTITTVPSTTTELVFKPR